jgi:hypothetical protein
MRRHEHEPILKEVLGGSELSNLRQTTLEHGLAALRRRRRVRLALRVGGVVGAAALAAVAITIDRIGGPPPRSHPAPAKGPLAAVTTTGPTSHAIKVISDEELFALFPGRAMALIGKPGHQDFVILDGKPPRQEIQ